MKIHKNDTHIIIGFYSHGYVCIAMHMHYFEFLHGYTPLHRATSSLYHWFLAEFELSAISVAIVDSL